jgi:dTDP-4-amino-4,6-dideoxygalactose transaminase
MEIEGRTLLGALLQGKKNSVESLTEAVREFFGVKEVLLTPSGRGGLYLLLKALKAKKVLIPAYTCRAVVEAAILAGKEVRFVDIDIHTYNMNPDLIEEKADEDTVILATHQFGIPCEIEKIQDIAVKKGAIVLEDAAASFNAKFKGRKVGTFGKAAILSFEYTKPFTCGRGGAILFNDLGLYDALCNVFENEVKNARTQTLLKYIITTLAYLILTRPGGYKLVHFFLMKRHGVTSDRGILNLKKNELYTETFSRFQAGVGLNQLKEIEAVLEKRKKIADLYLNELSSIRSIELPRMPSYVEPSLMRFPIRIIRGDKHNFYWECVENGLDLGFGYSYSCASGVGERECPNSFLAARQVLNLPFNSKLLPQEIGKIVSIVKSVSKDL